MKLAGEGKLLRVFIGEADRVDGHMLSETIVRKARGLGLAGATVLRGIEGFGAASRIHTAKILRLSEDLPIIVEIVDTEEKIASFLPVVEDLFERSKSGGLITQEKVEVIHYTSGNAEKLPH
jgi:PII-like signaling protein